MAMERGAPRSAALAFAGALVFAACSSGDGGEGPSPVTAPTGPTADTGPAISAPEIGAIVEASIGVGLVPLEVAVGEGAVWVSNAEDDTISKIDPSTNEVTDTIEVCAAPEGFAVGAGSVWVVCEDDAAVARIDPRRGRVVSEIEVELQPRFGQFAFGSVWVSNYLDGSITRIDPRPKRSSQRSRPSRGRRS